MILYRLSVDTADGCVVLQRWDHGKVAIAPVTGDFIHPTLADGPLFEVTSRLWEINEEPGLIVMASQVPDQDTPDGYIGALEAAGWARSES